MKPWTYIDLFCGCGGFSLGLQRAGFQELAALDFNPQAVSTFKANFPHIPKERIIEADLTEFGPEKLDAMLMPINSRSPRPKVDVIVGGPPCQGFSPARRVGGGNHGKNLVPDKRRDLYKQFLAYVAFYQPRIFVMENVLGIRSAAGGEFFTRVQSEARALGYRVHGEELRAWQFGVPQKRIRQVIIGTRREMPIFSASHWLQPTHREAADATHRKMVTLWEAIGDLPPLAADEGSYETIYDLGLRRKHLEKYGKRFHNKILQIQKAEKLTNHVSRPHSERDLRDFRLLLEGESSAVAMRDRHVKFEWPYSKEHFKDRYTRQHRNQLCSTIVAHLSKDGLMFIHPTQCRSLTPREAARVQTFPDWFIFPKERTHAFRLIGNAVPPELGRAIGMGLQKYLTDAERVAEGPVRIHPLPADPAQAVSWLEFLVDAVKNRSLAKVSDSDFKRGWFALGCLYPRLHPEGVRNNGSQVAVQSAGSKGAPAKDFASPVYVQSGWPVSLVPIAIEAARRHQEGSLRDVEYHFSDAQLTGILWMDEEE